MPAGLEECTIAVVGAAASADGRPFLWKNRDTNHRDNQILHFGDGRHPYVAMVNSGERHRVWMGVNLAGFAVMNALSYNLADHAPSGITNGELMKLALERCSDIGDFEELLEETNGRRVNPSNLAVLDASGRAALFEAGGNSFVRFDADNPEHAPAGLMVRANFSLSADTSGLDTWRFRRSGQVLSPVAAGRGIRVEDLLRAARDLVSRDADPYPLPCAGAPPGFPSAIGYVDTRETINRSSTAAMGIVWGVRPGEHPALTTFFAGLGQPVAAPVLPFWAAAGDTPPEVSGGEAIQLNHLTRERGQALYNFAGNPLLLDTGQLVIDSGGIAAPLPLAERIEAEVLAETARRMAFWRESCTCPGLLREAEWDLATWVTEEYRSAQVVRPGDAEAFCISAHPNPSAGSVWFVIDPGGPPPESWLIEIFDAAGRKVAEIRDPDLRPGNETARRRLLWDGAGFSGRPLPGGVYFGRAANLQFHDGVRLVRVP